MEESKINKAMERARELGVFRPRDLVVTGTSGEYVRRLAKKGLVTKVGRGLYVIAEHSATENHDIAESSKIIPHGVICLLSALRFHGLTTQNPYQVWMAIGAKSWQSETRRPAIRFVRFSGIAFDYGIEQHSIENVKVRIYTPAKTVADCFKYRNKIGLNVALEALRDCWQQRKATMDELWQAAKVCRVSKVMKPYLESLI